MQKHISCLRLTSLDSWQDLSTVIKVSGRRFLDTTYAFQKQNSKMDKRQRLGSGYAVCGFFLLLSENFTPGYKLV